MARSASGQWQLIVGQIVGIPTTSFTLEWQVYVVIHTAPAEMELWPWHRLLVPYTRILTAHCLWHAELVTAIFHRMKWLLRRRTAEFSGSFVYIKRFKLFSPLLQTCDGGGWWHVVTCGHQTWKTVAYWWPSVNQWSSKTVDVSQWRSSFKSTVSFVTPVDDSPNHERAVDV